MGMRDIVREQTWIADVKRSTAAAAAVKVAYSRLPKHIRREIRISAKVAKVPLFDAICSNLAYEIAMAALGKAPSPADLMSGFVGVKAQPVGCTTFAVITADAEEEDVADKLYFGRNLDWPDPKGLLARSFVKAPKRVGDTQAMRRSGLPQSYEVVTFPGYSGVLTGYAPRRFAIALNAIETGEAARMAEAPTFLIRRVFEECPTFEDAVRVLSETHIAVSAMFTVVPTDQFRRPDEAVVIERSPTRYAHRHPVQVSELVWVLAATNSPRKLPCQGDSYLQGLSETSDRRYDTVLRMARQGHPESAILREVEFGCTIYRAYGDLLSSDTMTVR